MAHARRGAGRDQVTDTEGHETAQIGDERANGEHHVFRVPALPTVAVDRGPEREPLRVRNLVGAHEPWSDRRERIGALPLGGAATVLHLERALGDIVHEAIGRHVTEGLGLVGLARVLADDRYQLDLVVELDGALRTHSPIVGPLMALFALMKIVGSFGRGSPTSSAWSV